MNKSFDPGLVCELCGEIVNSKININQYGVPGFIHYCEDCREKILMGEIK